MKLQYIRERLNSLLEQLKNESLSYAERIAIVTEIEEILVNLFPE